MSAMNRWLKSLSTWRRRDAVWREMDEEMRQHVELEAEDLVRQGVPPEEARRRARIAFGPVEKYREEGWEERLPRWLEEAARDFRVSARGLRRTPGFTVMAVTCIALGIGVTAATFALFDAVWLRALPFRDGDRLVAVYASRPQHDDHHVNISRLDFIDWHDRAGSFERLSMWTWSTLTLAGGGEAERINGADVSPDLFRTLGVAPALGRDFAPDEDRAGRERVLLLSDGLWQRRFGGDRGVLGRSVLVDGVSYTIVGVMPPGFAFPSQGEAWRPLAGDPALDSRGNRSYAGAIGRLRRGVTLERARAEMAQISHDLGRAFPAENLEWEAELIPLRRDLFGDLERPVVVFSGAVVCVLLIACANVANLLLVRGAARRRELALRTAIGAGRGQVVRHLLAESLLLAVLGAGLGVALAAAGVRLVGGAFPDGVPFYLDLALDGRALALVALLAVATAALVGVLPALRVSAPDLGAAMREGSAAAGEGTQRVRARSALVVAEVALTVVLLVGAGLLVRSYRALLGTKLGFEPRGVLSFQVAMPAATYPEPERRATLVRNLLEHVASLPGVESVGSARGIPMSGWNVKGGVSVEGRAASSGGGDLEAHYQTVTPGFFRTLRVPLLHGRFFEPADRDPEAPVVIVNESFARAAFHGQDPIGRRVKVGELDSPEPWATVVGVVRDFRHYRLPEEMGPALYYDYYQYRSWGQTVVVRSRGDDPAALVPVIRRTLRELDPGLPMFEVKTLDEAVSQAVWRQRLQGQTLGVFAGMALLLALVGLYGVVAYTVGQRTREIGLRLALGASGSDIVRVVIVQGASLVGAGILVGLVGALLVTRPLAALLYEVQPIDPVTFIGLPLVLAVVALVASSMPALFALRVDPQRVLRGE